MENAAPKISYCITCKGRAHHLIQTLPHNLALEKDNPNIEFVVLDYDSKDGLGEWIQQNLREELESGRVRYARFEPAPNFKMAHAKNMAHRVATGDILCNLDADNFLAPGFTTWMRDSMVQEPKSFITSLPLNAMEFLTTRLSAKVVGNKPLLGGRVALWRDDFLKLGGYDERFTGWSPDDVNMAMRARESGLKPFTVPDDRIGHSVEHSNMDRLANLSTRDQVASAAMLHAPKSTKLLTGIARGLKKPAPRANPSGEVGCGSVRINFSEQETPLEPLQLAKETVAERESRRREGKDADYQSIF